MVAGAAATWRHRAVSVAAAAARAGVTLVPVSARSAAQNAVMAAVRAGASGRVPMRGVDWLSSANTCSEAAARPP